MPVFKSYVNNKGNYIRARPSDTGNITYQTSPEADEFLQKLEYADDDDLPWGIINPLRAAGLIYTEGQGTEPDMDDAPELDPSKLATISSDEAEKLLSYLQSRGDVPNEVYDQLREIIRDSKKDDVEILVDKLESQTRASITVSAEESPEDYDLNISIEDSPHEDDEYLYFHNLYMDKESADDESEYYIRHWSTGALSTTHDAESMIKVHESKLDITRAMASLNELSFATCTVVTHKVTR
jgi:hypothetical protein